MIEILSETGSTNADLLARLRQGEAIADGYWLVADRQNQGRGRQRREWIDAPGNFMGSTVVNLSSSHEPPPATLSFVAALAVYESVLPIVANPRTLQLKWPNDVMLDKAKFCGLLLEREGACVVIGIGVNLAAAPVIEGRKVSALNQTNPAPSRDHFASTLAEQFAVELHRWREYGSSPILDRWRAAAHPPGTPLAVHQPDGTVMSGTFEALGHDGALLLRLPDGATTAIHAGDVMLEES